MTRELTDADLSEMEGRLSAALGVAPAPWEAFLETRHPIVGGSFVGLGDTEHDDEMYIDLHFGTEKVTSPDSRLDAILDFIANATSDVPRLISEVRRLRQPA